MSGSTGGSKCGECGGAAEHTSSCSRSNESVDNRRGGGRFMSFTALSFPTTVAFCLMLI